MKLILIALLYQAVVVYGSNILVVLPLPTFSHTNAFLPIMTELAHRGHNVTMVSPYPQKKPIPNFNDVVLENTLNKVLNHSGNRLNLRSQNPAMKFLGLWPLCNRFLDPVFELPEFQEFLKDRHSKFDLIMLEAFFCMQPLLALGHKYGAPVISMVSTSITPGVSAISGNPHPFAYVPNMKLKFTDHMTFWQRVQNTFIGIVDMIVDELYGIPLMENYMKDHFKGFPGFENIPSLSEMQRNISLFLVDNDLSLSYPRPYLPNIVEFGGLSVKSGEKLPADLDKFMNESNEGVIFFTWGSHYEMTNMSPELLSCFMSVFGKLKQRVLMKWEKEVLPGKPDNVKIDKWFPQASILSHPNIRLFITHGGIHGVTEAIFNAVPILGTPIFGDHYFNLRMTEQSGVGISIDIDTVTEEELSMIINKLLHDPKFKENAKRKSMIFKDRPLSILDNAVYWVEYALRHNGARHLRPASLDLTWYQNWLLDVIALFIAITAGITALFIYGIKLICKLFKKERKANEKGNKKNKKSKKD